MEAGVAAGAIPQLPAQTALFCRIGAAWHACTLKTEAACHYSNSNSSQQ
jgi:hypothetical protein